MLWLYIHFPFLQLDSLISEASDNKVIIVDSRKNEVVQVSTSACNDGVRLNMGLGAAASLSHDVRVLPYDEHQEQKMLQQLCQQLYFFTADIAPKSPKGLLIKVSSMLSLHGSLFDYWQALSQILARFNVSYYAATAYTPDAAELLAYNHCQLISDQKSDIHKQLEKLPVSALLLASKTKIALEKTGIKTVAQLQQVPRAELALRFSKGVVNYVEALDHQNEKGIFSHHYGSEFYQPPDFFEYELTLLFDVNVLTLLEFPVNKALKLLENYLIQKNYLAQHVQLSLVLRDHAPVILQVSSAEPSNKASYWLTLILLQLETVKLTDAVIAIALKVDKFQRQQGEINDLYHNRKGQLTLKQLASLLLNKLGEKKVSGLATVNDHRPELSFTHLAFVSEEHDNVPEGVNKKCVGRKTVLRPSFLLSEPEPVTEAMSIIHGPERIQTAWWDVNEVVRDYFIARNQQGQWCWLYKQPDNQWFIHGYFS